MTATATQRAIEAMWAKGVETFSVLKASEGGTSYADLRERLAYAGIPSRRVPSPYVGHYGIEVPVTYCARAERIVLGGAR